MSFAGSSMEGSRSLRYCKKCFQHTSEQLPRNGHKCPFTVCDCIGCASHIAREVPVTKSGHTVQKRKSSKYGGEKDSGTSKKRKSNSNHSKLHEKTSQASSMPSTQEAGSIEHPCDAIAAQTSDDTKKTSDQQGVPSDIGCLKPLPIGRTLITQGRIKPLDGTLVSVSLPPCTGSSTIMLVTSSPGTIKMKCTKTLLSSNSKSRNVSPLDKGTRPTSSVAMSTVSLSSTVAGSRVRQQINDNPISAASDVFKPKLCPKKVPGSDSQSIKLANLRAKLASAKQQKPLQYVSMSAIPQRATCSYARASSSRVTTQSTQSSWSRSLPAPNPVSCPTKYYALSALPARVFTHPPGTLNLRNSAPTRLQVAPTKIISLSPILQPSAIRLVQSSQSAVCPTAAPHSRTSNSSMIPRPLDQTGSISTCSGSVPMPSLEVMKVSAIAKLGGGSTGVLSNPFNCNPGAKEVDLPEDLAEFFENREIHDWKLTDTDKYLNTSEYVSVLYVEDFSVLMGCFPEFPTIRLKKIFDLCDGDFSTTVLVVHHFLRAGDRGDILESYRNVGYHLDNCAARLKEMHCHCGYWDYCYCVERLGSDEEENDERSSSSEDNSQRGHSDGNRETPSCSVQKTASATCVENPAPEAGDLSSLAAAIRKSISDFSNY